MHPGRSSDRKAVLQAECPSAEFLGLILFTTYIPSHGSHKIMSRLSPYMLYAEDSQIYISFWPSLSSSLNNALTSLTLCVTTIKTWMSRHFLKFNMDKTEVLVITTPSLSCHVSLTSLTLADAEVQATEVLHDLGATLDSKLQLEKQVSNTV
jgi:hypothetical protein